MSGKPTLIVRPRHAGTGRSSTRPMTTAHTTNGQPSSKADGSRETRRAPKANVGRMTASSKAITLPGCTRPDTVMDVNLGYPSPKRKLSIERLQQVWYGYAT